MFHYTEALALNDAGSLAVPDSLAAVASDSAAAAWKLSGWEAVQAGDGIMITIVGILVVFAALTTITFLIKALKVLANPAKRKATLEDQPVAPLRNGISGEVVAAIALALQSHLYELHDEERTVLTITKVSRPYSPWSSKLYTMTPSPTHLTIKR
jgi:Na+-transporting methylmalonyl-CoA/oxaloacetate decarboxylase gamma subunit